MNEISFPTQSNATIIKASVIASVMAVIIFVTIILPAEYNIDPSGVGKSLGLTVLAGDSNQANAEQTSSVDSNASSAKQTLVINNNKDQATLVVPANQGIEYKFKMSQYSNLTYEWTTEGGSLYFDFHGEPKGDTTGYFESYTIATATQMKGSMTVPFDGVHGWYWKNNSDQPIRVTLKTEGDFELVGLIH
jgi:hypothetical protein